MRILRFIKALFKYILFGNKVSVETYKERLDLCDDCPYENRKKMVCGKCGCYLTAKLRMSTEKCPEGKW